MANIILFDNETRENLLPLTFTRPVCELRMGVLRIREKWERWLNATASFITQDYLSAKYGIDYDDDNYFINGSALPSPELVALVRQMEYNEALLQGEELIAARLDARQLEKLMKDDDIEELKGIELGDTPFIKINGLTDLFSQNARAIAQDVELLTKKGKFFPVPSSCFAKAKSQIFLEEGAEVEGAFLNASDGPIFIGRNARIMEGSMIRGPVAIGEHAQVRMGAKIYGGTTIGPWCKAGGEIVESVLLEYSNKAHDGFLGHSYLGAWTNIGADTNTSNLKNNYENVRLWSYTEKRFVDTGTQFCGLIMGDHSKTAINVMLNTGTVIGVSTNIYGEGFPRNFVPSFSWGGHSGFRTFKTEKAFETMERVMDRRQQTLDIEDRLIYLRVYEETQPYRSWDKTDS
jgi:UDP-N-acetylglucosamine diphosphorylase/glucosamine-1-phosphate N-acetyltransferase